MKIIENQYKLGQKVGVRNGDVPQRIDPGWVVGINLSDDCKDITYSISDGYDELRRRHVWVYDGVKEIDLYPESCINSE
jgi:hypothetical protein